jgi:hypothetical protein
MQAHPLLFRLALQLLVQTVRQSQLESFHSFTSFPCQMSWYIYHDSTKAVNRKLSDFRLSCPSFQDRHRPTKTPPPMLSRPFAKDRKSRVPLHARSLCASPRPCARTVPASRGPSRLPDGNKVPFLSMLDPTMPPCPSRAAAFYHLRHRPGSPTCPCRTALRGRSIPPGPTLPQVRLRRALPAPRSPLGSKGVAPPRP